ncbi:MAG: S8 family serine peptidase [Rhodothermales bacterium]|nr:S8 family serine peptidase [Rhodothermales bacterium]
MGFFRTGLPAMYLLSLFAPASVAQSTTSFLEARSIRAAERERLADVRGLDHAPEDGSVALIGMSDGHPVYFGTQNDAVALAMGVRGLHLRAGASLTGAGQIIGLWDEGPVYADHQELSGRVADQDGGAPSSHATHVAGTLAAAGIDPDARGMAPAARLRSHDWLLHATEMLEAAQGGMLLSNHSYGRVTGWHRIRVSDTESVWYWFGDPRVSTEEDYAFGAYDQDAAHFDAVTDAFPYFLPVVAAGNDRDDPGPSTGTYWALTEQSRWTPFDVSGRRIAPDGGESGYDTIASFALAKNALTVGSLAPAPAGVGDRVSGFSGMGPTDDGRVKPDVISPGEDLYSPVALGPASYRVSSGTSMAAPTVTGSLALLQELAENERGAPLRAASLKGLVLHTARDVGAPGPDYSSGWGRFDAAAAAETLLDATHHPTVLMEMEHPLVQSHRVPLTLDLSGPLRLTLSWTDAPGQPLGSRSPDVLDNPTPHLVRDLDLRLYHLPSGLEYRPFVLDPAAPQAVARPGDNRVDPIEQIDLREALAGSYIVEVSMKNAPDTPVAFTLLVAGARDDADPVTVDSAHADVRVDRVELTWTARQERLAGAYVIERAVIGTEGFNGPLDARFEPVALLPARLDATLPGSAEVAVGKSYTYTEPIDASGVRFYRMYFVAPRSNTRFFITSLRVDVPLPARLAVVSAFPNPFRGRATALIDVPETQQVVVELVDVLGRRRLLLVDAPLAAGRHTVPIEAEALPAGLYYIRLIGTRGTATRSIIHMPGH